MEHTKGEWAWQSFNGGIDYSLVAQHGKREVILSANNGKYTKTPYISMSNDGVLETVNPNHPNAKLIAAAPELLEALQAVKRHGLIEKEGYETVVGMVSEAIKKATV